MTYRSASTAGLRHVMWPTFEFFFGPQEEKGKRMHRCRPRMAMESLSATWFVQFSCQTNISSGGAGLVHHFFKYLNFRQFNRNRERERGRETEREREIDT
jgi:hypothetical protein